MATATLQRTTSHPTNFGLVKSSNLAARNVSNTNDVKTTLNYRKDPEDGNEPHPSYVGKPETYERPITAFEVTVKDIRPAVDSYTLDKNGFRVHQHASIEKEFLDDEQIKAGYYPETEQLLKDVTGATRVFIFDHTIRRTPAASTDETSHDTPQTRFPLRGPVKRVHIDQSYAASENRVRHHFPTPASLTSHLLKSRHQIINVWRPIKTIRRDPLGVADAKSVPDTDLVPIALIYPDRRGETLGVRPSAQHKWYHLHEQTPEEVLLIKCYDSIDDGRARRVPHTAFENKRYAGPEWDERESIEVRALVFHEDEEYRGEEAAGLSA